MKRIILFALIALLAVSCGRVKEEVVLTWPNGKPQLVNLYKEHKGQRTLVGEKMFYQNGQLRASKHFAGSNQQPDGQWQYFYPSGDLFAQGQFDAQHPLGAQWTFRTSKGKPFVDGAVDSVSVLELSELQIPSTVAFHQGDTASICQFFDNFDLRSQGMLSGNKRVGHWFFYYPGGTVQEEAVFIDGVQNGRFNVYRENGVPYYIGYYINGQRAGIWEFYDEQGNLSGTKNFDR